MSSGTKLTNEEFLQKLKDKNIPYIPLEEYKGSNVKIKWLCYKNSLHIFEMRPRAIFDGQGCPYCSGNKLLVGYNDCWTTRPDIAVWLKNPEDGYSHFCNSHKKVYWLCPNCGNEIYKDFHSVSQRGLACSVCGDGVSYPEKIIISMLNQLKIGYIHDKPRPWSDKKRYDFYLPDYNLIIETHGNQHYAHGFSSINSKKTKNKTRTLEEEQINDFYKRELAFTNNIKHYIELDCRESELGYIKNSIINSELNCLFDLSKVDWIQCELDTHKTFFIDVLNHWNSGIRNSVDIAKLLNLDRHTVQKYLKVAASHSMCDYNSEEGLKNGREKAYAVNCRKVVCTETKQIFNSIKDAAFFAKVTYQGISSACRGEQETSGGYHWIYYDEYLKSN